MQTVDTTCLLFYFPMNVAMVDDDEDILNILASQFRDNEVSPHSTPEDLISSIDPININIKEFIHEIAHGTYDLNFSNVKKFVDNNSNKHGIVISDYEMPSINGIDLLHKFNDFDVVKVLLTNVFTIEEAVNALNNGTIDFYLPKDHIHDISEIINDLQLKFFKKKTREILKTIDTNSIAFINDGDYIKLFNTVCSKYNIIKYHILNSYGGYFLENTTEIFVFNIFHKSDLEDIANGFTEYHRTKIKTGNSIPSHLSRATNGDNLMKAEKHGDYFFNVERILQDDHLKLG